MAITNLPTPPSRSDPENFPERADVFMAALPRFATEANTLQEQVNEAAASVDADAAAAGASRDAAAESLRLAGLSAQGAETARQAASQKAGEADANAQRAKQWATKIGAPVEGDGFSAKHYAELAAQGAGLPIYMPDSVPSQDVGPIFIVRQGNAEWDQASGRYRVHSSIALGTVAFWPMRSSIPAGHIPADGQTVSRATFPDLAQMVIDGKLPVVTDADWLADPLKRGSYTLGNGSTTIRLPDYNGRAAGSVGALFMRGDGALSSGTNGVIQRDALQNINGTFDIGWGALLGRLAMDPTRQVSGPLRYNLGPGAGRVINSDLRSGYNDYLESYTFDASLVARTATETRPSNVSGVWTIQAFGTVVNPGSVNAAQLASDYAVLNSAVQGLQVQPVAHGQCRFVYVSSTECRLMPYNGNGLIINGRQYRIPVAGVALLNTGLAASATYYVFAMDNGAGAITLDVMGTSATTRVRHTDGVEIRTGDPSRTLVGMVTTTATSQFFNTIGSRRVASWFNRKPTILFEGSSPSSTASTSYVQLTSGLSSLIWKEDIASIDCAGAVWPTGGGNAGAYLIITLNGGAIAGDVGYSLVNGGAQMATAIVAAYQATSDALYTFGVYGRTNSGALPVTFRQDLRGVVSL